MSKGDEDKQSIFTWNQKCCFKIAAIPLGTIVINTCGVALFAIIVNEINDFHHNFIPVAGQNLASAWYP